MATWCVADLHGELDIWEKANKELLKPEDTIYFLGDAVDRGLHGWKLFNTLLNDPRVIFIKGNHEQMFHNSLCAIRDNEEYSYDIGLHCMNGGANTLNEWRADSPNDFSAIKKIEKLPLYDTYTNDKGFTFILTHSGFSFEDDFTDEDNFYWNRAHFEDFWDEKKYPYLLMIHGHTPTLHLVKKLNTTLTDPTGAFWYCKGHKIDIDVGACFTGKGLFFNLDTFEEKVIDITDK